MLVFAVIVFIGLLVFWLDSFYRRKIWKAYGEGYLAGQGEREKFWADWTAKWEEVFKSSEGTDKLS